jgi:hypothetical protein
VSGMRYKHDAQASEHKEWAWRFTRLRVVLVFLLFFGETAFANDHDSQFIAGLRQRRLFELAEFYCDEQLTNDQLAEADRAELTVELVRVYSEHALNSRGTQRETLWQQAQSAALPFQESNQPRAVLVRVQDALASLARGELERMESEVAFQPDDALATARETLRAAASKLTTIDRELTEAIPARRRNPLRPNELSGDQLTSLQNNVRYQLARAYKNQALCYPAASSDRTASLTAAIEQLEQPLVQLAPGQALYVDLRLEQIACLQLLGDSTGAAAYLKTLGNEDLSPNNQLRVRAAQIRLHLARGESSNAMRIVAKGRRIAATTSAEVDFAFLETYVSLWIKATDGNDQAEVSRWRSKSIATSKFIEQEHGTYWARRAELLLIRVGAGSGDGSVEILRRMADDLYRKGSFGDAVVAYDKAANAAQETGDVKLSFELSYKAALVLQQEEQYAEAASYFRRLAVAQAKHAHASNAHLLAIANARQASVAASKWLDSYPELLREHLAKWPASDSISRVAFWLGEFEVGRGAWRSALEALSKVKADSDEVATTKQWLDLFRQIAQSKDTTNDHAALVIAFATRLDSKASEFDETQSFVIAHNRARALVTVGDRSAAQELYARLADEHPNNGSLQEEYAQLLLDSDDETSWPKSLDRWRRVASRTRPRTSRWYRAKYSIALAQHKLNDDAGAIKLIRYLQATEELKQSGLEQEFAELLSRCVGE